MQPNQLGGQTLESVSRQGQGNRYNEIVPALTALVLSGQSELALALHAQVDTADDKFYRNHPELKVMSNRESQKGNTLTVTAIRQALEASDAARGVYYADTLELDEETTVQVMETLERIINDRNMYHPDQNTVIYGRSMIRTWRPRP